MKALDSIRFRITAHPSTSSSCSCIRKMHHYSPGCRDVLSALHDNVSIRGRKDATFIKSSSSIKKAQKQAQIRNVKARMSLDLHGWCGVARFSIGSATLGKKLDSVASTVEAT
jgi:hypothetical protein